MCVILEKIRLHYTEYKKNIERKNVICYDLESLGFYNITNTLSRLQRYDSSF